ncbi:MAG: 50S ribosomal protein L4 [Deltaproteobacteria bacterium]|nr:50S ribosomal protein L4 [Deltaproteobacteria bacterium]MBI2500316.1 50S ribosomal protein L4 [Deltaproteobacteria bacterium]MBI4196478.1 50S ribosomal protein L4 [Deltaproteobacteria bacterium]
MTPEITVYNSAKKKVGTLAWPEQLSVEVSTGRIHQVAVNQLRNRRQGNAHVKSRHFVSGSTRKIYRQKGTGRARHGDIRAPLFVGGGRAFGPRARDWTVRTPRQISRAALRDLLSLRRSEEKLWIVDRLEMKAPKTKEASSLLASFGLSSGLVVLGEANPAVERSMRNLATFKVTRVDSLNLLDLLRYENLMMTQSAFETLVKRFS